MSRNKMTNFPPVATSRACIGKIRHWRRAEPPESESFPATMVFSARQCPSPVVDSGANILSPTLMYKGMGAFCSDSERF